MDLTHSALLVVDFQNDFCPPTGALALKQGRSIAPLINRLLALPFRLRVATQDWHPANHVSFASSHPDVKPDTASIAVRNPLNPAEEATVRLFPDHCVQGTPGAELVDELDVSKLNDVVRKGDDARVEMFSGFGDTTFASPCVARTRLLDLLVDAGVDEVFVVGLAGDVCVKATAEGAAGHGLRTTVLADGVRCLDESEAGRERLTGALAERGVRFLEAARAGLL